MTESEAREIWNNWTEDQRMDFIVQRGYNPRFAKFAWPMLPFSVQQEVQIPAEPLSIPNVVGCCSGCGWAYDLTKGIGCPQCSSMALSWALQVNSEDEQAEMIKRLRDKLAPERELSEEDKIEIAELERIFKL